MVIKKLKISNFKSFDELEIELGRFNVLKCGRKSES